MTLFCYELVDYIAQILALVVVLEDCGRNAYAYLVFNGQF